MVILRRLLVLGVLMTLLAGCGETVRGVRGDASRIGRGVKQIFVSDR